MDNAVPVVTVTAQAVSASEVSFTGTVSGLGTSEIIGLEVRVTAAPSVFASTTVSTMSAPALSDRTVP